MGGMNPGWLAQLAPDHPPPPPGWWPPAPGWWALAVLVLLLAATAIYLWRRPQARLRRTALRELSRLEALPLDDRQFARELESLLRRYALASHGSDATAGLMGADWLAFLAAHGGAELGGEAGQSLLRAAYGGSGPNERAHWLAGARKFLGRRGIRT